MDMSRRDILAGAGALAATAASGSAMAQSFAFKPNQRYPEPSLEILDPSFLKYRVYSSTIEQIVSGFRWAEGPAYFPDGGYLLWSDIPNNRIMKYDEKDGSVSVFRSPSAIPTGSPSRRTRRNSMWSRPRRSRTAASGATTSMRTAASARGRS